MLGQIVLHQEAWTCNQEVGTQRTQALLNGQSWASLHDAYSVKFADRFFREIPDGADSSPSTARRFATGSNAREAERKVLASLAARNLVIGVATDHETDWIDSSAEVVTIPWIIPGLSGGARLHLCHWCEFSDDPRRHRLYF